MIQRDVQIHAERRNYGRSIVVDLFREDAMGEVLQVAKPLEFVPANYGVQVHQPAIELYQHQAQQLMDRLWDAGLRPTQGQQSEGQFAAQTRHLEDMRHMVASAINTGLPGLPPIDAIPGPPFKP